MLKCKNCGAKIADDEHYCPSCGEKADQTVSRDDLGMDEFFDEDAASCATVADNRDEHTEQRKKNGRTVMLAAVAVCAVAAIVVTLFVTGVFGGKPTGNSIVASYGDRKLTNAELAYYYWGEYYYLENYYAQYGMSLSEIINPNVSFAQQEFSGEEWETWHDYFFEMAVENWANTLVIYNAALEANHEMDADRLDNLASLSEQLETEASTYGFASVDQMIKSDYGAFASYEGYRQYLEHQYLAFSYVGMIYQGFIDQNTVEVDMIPSVNIRHILLSFETNGDAAKEMADAVYNEWKANPTEEFFAQLATERTDDPGSQTTGGLYENVAPGDMVSEFDAWCFEQGRKTGDNGIVETTFGYHIMYYSGNGEPVPADYEAQLAAEGIAGDMYTEWVEGLLSVLGERELFIKNVDIDK